MTEDIQGTLSVVSHGHGALLRSLLTDLSQQLEIENWLVLVTLNIVEEFDETDFPALRLTVVRNPAPLGFGANHNAAARIARGRLFLIVNPDIRLPAHDTLSRFAQLDWSGAAAPLRAPVVSAPDGAIEDSVRANLSLPNLLRRSRERTRGWEIDPDDHGFFWLAGMFLVAPLATFQEIGGFNERFRLYCEDYDLSARWRVMGGAIEIIRDIGVVHDARRDSHRSWRHLRWHITSLARVWLSAPFWKVVTRRYSNAPTGSA